MGRHLGVHGQPQAVGPGAQLKGAVIADAKEERAKPYWNLMDPKVRSSIDP